MSDLPDCAAGRASSSATGACSTGAARGAPPCTSSHRIGRVLVGLVSVTVLWGCPSGHSDQLAGITRARQQVLCAALQHYHADNGSYPTEAQGLDALIEKPRTEPVPHSYPEGGYLHASLLLDSRQQRFHYELDATEGGPVVWSEGPTGEEGPLRHECAGG